MSILHHILYSSSSSMLVDIVVLFQNVYNLSVLDDVDVPGDTWPQGSYVNFDVARSHVEGPIIFSTDNWCN